MSMQVTMQCPRVSDFEQEGKNFVFAAILISLVGIVNIIAKKLIPPQGVVETVIRGPLALGVRVDEGLGIVAGLCLDGAVEYLATIQEIDNDLEIRAGIIVGLFLSYRLLMNCYSQFFSYVGGSVIGGLVSAGLLTAKNIVIF